jgi:hypothetical protein
MLRISLCYVFYLLLCFASSIEATPRQISFQGRQSDATGAPVPDGIYSVKFTLYDEPSMGNSLWSSHFVDLQFSNGLFSHVLGSTSPLPDSLARYDSLFLGISIGAEPEIVPRTPMISVPFAFTASFADSANGLTSSSGYRRLASDSTGTTVEAYSWTQAGGTLHIGPGEVSRYIIVELLLQSYLQSGSAQCGDQSSQFDIRIGEAGSESSRTSGEFQRLSANYLTNTGFQGVIKYYYEPNISERQNGFNVKIYLILAGNSGCDNPFVTLKRCDIYGW